MTANESYSEAKRQFSVRNKNVLMNGKSPHKWWSTLKSALFSSCSSLPPFVGGGGGLVGDSATNSVGGRSVGDSDLLSKHFDSKQSRESVDLQPTCHPSHSLITFAYRLSKIMHLLLTLALMVAPTYSVCFLFSLEN